MIYNSLGNYTKHSELLPNSINGDRVLYNFCCKFVTPSNRLKKNSRRLAAAFVVRLPKLPKLIN